MGRADFKLVTADYRGFWDETLQKWLVRATRNDNVIAEYDTLFDLMESVLQAHSLLPFTDPEDVQLMDAIDQIL